MNIKKDEWLGFEDTNKGLEVLKEKPLDYYSDVFSPWQTKQKLKIWREVEWIDIPVTSTIKYCLATMSADETTTSWTAKTLTLNTFDTNDTWMSVTSWRITITQDWLYCLTWAVTFASNASWAREVLLRKNWTSHTDLHYTVSWISWDLTSCVFTRYLNYVVWDYIEVRAYQTSWWSLNVTSNTQKTFVQVVKIN